MGPGLLDGGMVVRRAWALYSILAGGWLVGDGTYIPNVQGAMVFRGAAAFRAVMDHPNDIQAHAVWIEGFVQ